MEKKLVLSDGYYVMISASPEAIESSTIIQQWLYQFEYTYNDTLDYDTYRDMIISAKTYEEAETAFRNLLVSDFDYHESTWSADVIGIDLKLNREEPLVCSHYCRG